MHPDLEQLVALQDVDVEANRLREQLDAVPKRVAQSEAKAREADARRKAIATELATEEMLRRRLESEIGDQKLKLERNGKKIDAATTTVQVTALDHEASFARTEISRLEDQELESMERSETLETRRGNAQNEVAATELALRNERESAASSVRTDRAALDVIGRKQQELRADLLQRETGEASLARYDRIAKARGTAVSEASLGKCTACAMMLRPQLWQDLRDNGPDSPSRQTMSTCENCGRLLYYDPARDAPQRKPVHGESIAASIVRATR